MGLIKGQRKKKELRAVSLDPAGSDSISLPLPDGLTPKGSEVTASFGQLGSGFAAGVGKVQSNNSKLVSCSPGHTAWTSLQRARGGRQASSMGFCFGACPALDTPLAAAALTGCSSLL